MDPKSTQTVYKFNGFRDKAEHDRTSIFTYKFKVFGCPRALKFNQKAFKNPVLFCIAFWTPSLLILGWFGVQFGIEKYLQESLKNWHWFWMLFWGALWCSEGGARDSKLVTTGWAGGPGRVGRGKPSLRNRRKWEINTALHAMRHKASGDYYAGSTCGDTNLANE